MRKITAKERMAWKMGLEQRQTPAEMKRRWHAFHDDIGEEMLVQAGVEFMRDAYVAYRFAEFQGADEVWLVAAQRPDFGVLLQGQTLLYEATEADWPHRQRSREYKEKIIPERRAGTEKVEYAPDLFAMTADDASDLLHRAAVDKCDGRYDANCGLVILLQPGSMDTKEVEDVMPAATSVAREAFREVWVHWSDRFYLLWRDGVRA